MIFSGPFVANWKQSPLFMGNTKGFVLFTSDQLSLLFFPKWSKTISMGMGNYKIICTNHGQLKMIYSIDELLLFIPKWLKTISTIHGNPKVICITHVQLKTIHVDLHRWFIFTWTNKNVFSPFMGNWNNFHHPWIIIENHIDDLWRRMIAFHGWSKHDEHCWWGIENDFHQVFFLQQPKNIFTCYN